MQMQRLGQADLAGETQLDDAATTFASGARAGALQDAQFDAGRRDAEEAKEGEDGGTESVDRDVARFGGGGDDAGAGEAHVHVRLGEGREEAERQQKVGDAPGAGDGDAVLDYVSVGGAQAGNGAGDEARVVCDCCSGVRDLHGGAVGDGLEEAQEGDLVGGEAWVRG